MTTARPAEVARRAARGSWRRSTGREELLRPQRADPAVRRTASGLDSLTGTLLLREVHRRFGVDVAAEDLNLDALATLGTLAAFITERTDGHEGC